MARATAKKNVKKSAVKKPAKKAPSKKTLAKKPVAKKSAGGMTLGGRAPAFSLPATRIGTASSKALSGKPYVLYFYPKDDTSGCTAEACDFRDNLAAFNKLGVTVIGVSKDTLASHEKFAAKYHLTFPLASDADSDLCEKFGVWVQKSMYGRTYMGIERATFLIDGKGVVRAVWRKVSVTAHVAEVKKAAASL